MSGLADISVVYVVRRFFFRIYNFFHHWYFDGSLAIGRRFMATMTRADQTLAVAITLRHFFEPLYKDYSIVGRIMGIIFRTLRILVGAVCYLFLAAVFAALYLAWLAIPVTILYYAITNH
jgi:hypothetical protein